MNIYDYTNISKLNDERIKKANERKKILNNQAFHSHLFEVELGDLINELEKLIIEKTNDENSNLRFTAQTAKSFNRDSEKNAIRQIIFEKSDFVFNFYCPNIPFYYNLGTKVNLNQITFPNTKYEDYIDTDFWCDAHSLELKNVSKIKVNFDPGADYMKDKLFSKALINCIKNKEKQQKIEKIPEK